MTSAAPPGMYQDPEDPAQLRWWDGSQWTEHRPQPAAVTAPVQSPPADAAITHSGPATAQPAAATPTVAAPVEISKMSGLAVTALVAGLLTVSIVAIPCGHIAIYNIKHSGGTQRGKSMAVAGALLGWIWLGIGVVGLFLTASMGSQ